MFDDERRGREWDNRGSGGPIWDSLPEAGGCGLGEASFEMRAEGLFCWFKEDFRIRLSSIAVLIDQANPK